MLQNYGWLVVQTTTSYKRHGNASYSDQIKTKLYKYNIIFWGRIKNNLYMFNKFIDDFFMVYDDKKSSILIKFIASNFQ